MRELIPISEAALALDVDPSRVRSLIASGSLPAEKLAGRWFVGREGVLARRREPVSAGRPLKARNAWAMLLAASGDEPPKEIDAMALWRIRRSLAYPGLAAMRPRLKGRAEPHAKWAPAGELRALREDRRLVLSGSSAAGALGLQLVAPDAIDAYLPLEALESVVREHGLQDAPSAEANVLLRAVPAEAWMLDGRKVAPRAAVALDLASYPDARSASAGMRLLAELDQGEHAAWARS
jgi:hypothetical protein